MKQTLNTDALISRITPIVVSQSRFAEAIKQTFSKKLSLRLVSMAVSSFRVLMGRENDRGC